MKILRIIFSLSAMALVISGCSSRPRHFTATINPPAADEAAYQRDFTTCDTLARKGYKSNFKAAALSTVGGTAIGVAAGAAATAVAVASIGTAGGLGGIGTAIGTTAAVGSGVFFVAALPAGFGISRAIRSGREKRLKKTISSCLNEYGYTVAQWARVQKPKKVASTPS
jgi:hypothetical protein